MTQAINLANFSNSLDTSGQVPPSSLNAPVPISKGGTGASTAAAARSNLDVAQAVYAVPSGGIIMWSGSVGSIPVGWNLCDGSNGTPNLSNRFVVSVGSSFALGTTGGSADAIVVSHTHTATSTDSGHSHYELYSGGNPGAGPGISSANNTGTFSTSVVPTGPGNANISTTIFATGGSATNANLPPYYVLAFIMKA